MLKWTPVGLETSDRAQKDLIEVGRALVSELTQLGGRQVARLERAWWRWEMSDRAQKDLVEVGPSSCALVDTVGWETGSQTPKGLVEAGDKQLRLNGLSWVRNE